MKAMLLKNISDLRIEKNPLHYSNVTEPVPKENEILIKIKACGVCHTELDEIEGRTPPPLFPVIPGHQVVGIVQNSTNKFIAGDRIGVAWIFSSCGICEWCLSGLENLCKEFKATGRDANGGYADYMVVNHEYAYKIPDSISDAEAAPLLCAGAIGYRSLKLSNLKDGNVLGLTGFGASAHIVLKIAKYIYPSSKIFVFARSEKEREFAIELGADWAGDTNDTTSEQCNAIIDTTPVWHPVVKGLEQLKAGGRLVINAIRKEDVDKDVLVSLNYPEHLWMEKEIKSIANITRQDVSEFLKLASDIPIKPEYQEYELKDANKALIEMKERKIRGAKVLRNP